MKNFFDGLTGDLITPNDPGYYHARQEFNRAIQKYPLAILYCNNAGDAARAVLWSQKRCVGFRIRSGGHNYAGYSTGNNVLVIDISKLNEVKLDEEKGLLFVQGGATNRDVYNLLAQHNYPFPGGTCPTVGMAGLVSGGGWGLSCRQFGLTCDSLVQVRLINYRGQVITASDKCNPDLFWAIRGGAGGNFGIIIGMVFRLPPKTDNVTYIQLYTPNASARQQAGFWDAWQGWLPALDKRLSMQGIIYHSQEEGFAIYARGIFYGTPQEAQALLQPLSGLEGMTEDLQYVPFAEATRMIGESYPPFEHFRTASRFALSEIRPQDLAHVTSLIRDVPEGSVFNGISLYALGGEVAAKGRNSSFSYRRARYIISISSTWEDNDAAGSSEQWVQRVFNELKPLTQGAYVNFPYSELPHYLWEYYGRNVFLLSRIKQKYDPHNVFRYPQSIRPA